MSKDSNGDPAKTSHRQTLHSTLLSTCLFVHGRTRSAFTRNTMQLDRRRSDDLASLRAFSWIHDLGTSTITRCLDFSISRLCTYTREPSRRKSGTQLNAKRDFTWRGDTTDPTDAMQNLTTQHSTNGSTNTHAGSVSTEYTEY